MNKDTAIHLNAYLEANVHADVRDRVLNAILALEEHDADYLDGTRPWSDVIAAAGRLFSTNLYAPADVGLTNWAPRKCQYCDNSATTRETSTYRDGRKTVLHLCDNCKTPLNAGLAS